MKTERYGPRMFQRWSPWSRRYLTVRQLTALVGW